MEPHLSSYGPELAPESASEGIFFAQMRSFADIQTAAPDQAPAAAPFTQPASVIARAPASATAVSPAEAEAAAFQGAAEAVGAARSESAGSLPCDALKGGPAEWMKTGGAMGLACAQQVTYSTPCCLSGTCGVPLATLMCPLECLWISACKSFECLCLRVRKTLIPGPGAGTGTRRSAWDSAWTAAEMFRPTVCSAPWV